MSRSVSKATTTKRRNKALTGNFRRATIKRVHDHIKFVIPDDDDIGTWYFVLGATPGYSDHRGEFAGDQDEFMHGQYIGKIMATSIYPFGPPDVEMLTPTGVFPLNNKNFCIDIGRYHKDNYPATLGMDGYVQMIWSGLIGWRTLGSGINLVPRGSKKVATAVIAKAAEASVEYNKEHNAHILQLFEDRYGPNDEEIQIINQEIADMAL
jgi:hypothetical protein